MYQLEEIKNDLKNCLSIKRFEHCLRVADEAKRLARVYNVDEEKAYVAGLVHDIAKEFTEEENIKLVQANRLNDDLLVPKFKQVIHAMIGAIVVKDKYGLSDDICQAVRYHVTGNINMNLLDKIVFVADKIEPGKDYPGIDEQRVLAYENIDEALSLCLKNLKKKREAKGKKIHPDSLKLLDCLEKKSLS